MKKYTKNVLTNEYHTHYEKNKELKVWTMIPPFDNEKDLSIKSFIGTGIDRC